MPPKGWRKNAQKKSQPRFLEPPRWNDPAFIPFGDRLDFLSPEAQHLTSGSLKVLPPANPRRNAPDEAA